MDSGDPLNESEVRLPLHFGTHIDFPRHFDPGGRRPEDYPPEHFIFRSVQQVNLESALIGKTVISTDLFSDVRLDPGTDLLLIRTGMGRLRREESYGSGNPAFHPDLALFFRQSMPRIRAVGMDAVSIASRLHRDLGKEAHRKFLLESKILPIEDMDFSGVSASDSIDRVFALPIRMADSEAAPATIIARVGTNSSPGCPDFGESNGFG